MDIPRATTWTFICIPGWKFWGSGSWGFFIRGGRRWPTSDMVNHALPFILRHRGHWVALTAACVSMHALASRWLNRWDALFAACLFAANPYHILIVYWRSAFAELLASWLVPLLLLLLLQAAENRGREQWRGGGPFGLVT